MEEIWKDIIGYEGLYAISNMGRVKSFPKRKGAFSFKEERILKTKIKNSNYVDVVLCKNNKTKTITLHRLVATHFVNNPDNKPQVNHIDGNKQNNYYLNLEWCTASENLFNAYKIGLNRQDGEYHATKKLNWDKVREIRQFYLNGHTAPELSKKYGVHTGHIRYICYNIFWKDKNYIWDTRNKK